MNLIRRGSTGIILDPQPRACSASSVSNFEQTGKEAARRFGLGFDWIAVGDRNDPQKIGIVFRGPEGDAHGRMKGCLRWYSETMNAPSLYSRTEGDKWALNHIEHGKPVCTTLPVEGAFSGCAESLSTLLRTAEGFLTEPLHPAVSESFLVHEPGFFERWRRSLIDRKAL